jgi:hypothetical protein
VKTARLLLSVVLVVAAGGYALSAAAGWRFDARQAGLAVAAALLSAAAAFLPLVLTRGASQPAVAQAGLLGTLVHLLGCLVGAAALLFAKAGVAAVYWLLAFYWATLPVLVVAFSRALRKAPQAPAAGGLTATPKG